MRKFICKYCNKEVKLKDRQKKRYYCNSKCINDFHNTARYAAVKLIARSIKYKKRYCIGIYCRGVKTFNSSGTHNRICARCAEATKGHIDVRDQIPGFGNKTSR